MKINETTDPIYVNLDRETEHAFNNFIKELGGNYLHPLKLIKKYDPVFDELNKQFKKHILQKDNSKFGMFVTRYKKYRLEEYIKKEFNFTTTSRNVFMSYDKAKFIQLTLFEITLLLRRYNFIYPFMIRYAIYKVLTKHFTIYEKTNTGWNLLVYYGDLYDVYGRVVATDNHDLDGYDTELDKAVDWKRWETQKQDKHEIVINKPTSAEDIINLFGDKWDLLKQSEKYVVIADRYKCSVGTARRYLSQFGLCQKAKRKGVILEKQDNKTVDLQEEVRMLKEEIAKRDEEIARLKTELEKFKPKLVDNTDSSGLNFFKIDETLDF